MQGSFAAGMRGKWQRRAVLPQKCEESGNAGQFCYRDARDDTTQDSVAAEMRGKWRRRAVWPQKCKDSANAGEFYRRNASKAAAQGSLAAEMRGKWQRSTDCKVPKPPKRQGSIAEYQSLNFDTSSTTCSDLQCTAEGQKH